MFSTSNMRGIHVYITAEHVAFFAANATSLLRGIGDRMIITGIIVTGCHFLMFCTFKMFLIRLNE